MSTAMDTYYQQRQDDNHELWACKYLEGSSYGQFEGTIMTCMETQGSHKELLSGQPITLQRSEIQIECYYFNLFNEGLERSKYIPKHLTMFLKQCNRTNQYR
jgi:hypothetical protein